MPQMEACGLLCADTKVRGLSAQNINHRSIAEPWSLRMKFTDKQKIYKAQAGWACCGSDEEQYAPLTHTKKD